MSKMIEAGWDIEAEEGAALPAYHESAAGPSTHRESTAAPAYQEQNTEPSTQARRSASSQNQQSTSRKPTVDSPFDFPAEPPTYGPTSNSTSPFQKPLAIPQIKADPASPFLQAYPPSLLSYGITADTWRSFLDTMSAFLAAKVSDRAIAHAADIGKYIGNVQMSFGKETVNHAKSVGQVIKQNAKSGNIIGAALGVVGGAIALPVCTALRGVAAVVTLPGTMIAAAVQRPQTPKARAAAYAAAANKKWLHPRGLHAQLLDTMELGVLVNTQGERIVETARSIKGYAAEQLNALSECIADVEVQSSTALEVGASSLWLIVTRDAENTT